MTNILSQRGRVVASPFLRAPFPTPFWLPAKEVEPMYGTDSAKTTPVTDNTLSRHSDFLHHLMHKNVNHTKYKNLEISLKQESTTFS